MLLPHQKAFVDDPEEFVCALVASRGGKTTASLAKADQVARRTRFGDMIYIALTKQQAVHIVWPQLKKYDDEFAMGLKFNETLKEATWPNQTKLRLFGGDRLAEIDRLRGQAFDQVIIDEGKSYDPATLHELIREVLEPRIGDRFGQMMCIGTPGHIMAGPFYEMTTGTPSPLKDWGYTKGWSKHYWNLQDNTAMPHLWERALRRKKSMGWADEDPVWMREYLGMWAGSPELLVLRFNEEQHLYTEIPSGAFKHVLCCKFSPDHTFSLAVLAYSKSDPRLYLVEDFRDTDITLTQAASLIRELETKYGGFSSRTAITNEFNRTLIDTFNMKYQFGLQLSPAEDTKALIELVNTDLYDNRVLLPEDSHAVAEMRLLHWKDNKKEHFGDALPSDVSECFLHAWKHCYHHLAKPVIPGVAEGTPEWWRRWEDEQFDEACREDRQIERQERRRTVWFQRKSNPWLIH